MDQNRRFDAQRHKLLTGENQGRGPGFKEKVEELLRLEYDVELFRHLEQFREEEKYDLLSLKSLA